MKINNLEINFVKADQGKLFFKASSGQEIVFDESLLSDVDDKEKLFLSLSKEASPNQPKDVLNDILEIE